MKDKKELHQVIILISILIILIINFGIFSYKIYALITEPTQLDNTTYISEGISNNENSEILVTTIKEDEEDTNNIEINEEVSQNITNSVGTAQTSKSISSKTYTASNGEKYTKIAKLNIPSLGIQYDVLSHTTTALMKISVTKYWGPEPNQPGNLCIIGHNYRNTKFFGKLENIKKDSIVQITDASGKTLEYKVYDTYLVDPDDNSCTSQLNDGHTDITLITCTDDATQRFIVKARAY